MKWQKDRNKMRTTVFFLSPWSLSDCFSESSSLSSLYIYFIRILFVILQAPDVFLWNILTGIVILKVHVSNISSCFWASACCSAIFLAFATYELQKLQWSGRHRWLEMLASILFQSHISDFNSFHYQNCTWWYECWHKWKINIVGLPQIYQKNP